MRTFLRKPLYWILLALDAGAALFLAFGVFGIQALFTDTTIEESFGVEGATLVASGAFHDVEHKGQSGNASVYLMRDGSHRLRLEGVKIDNGPALHVVVVASDDARDNARVKSAGFVDLGKLRGNLGNQTYDLPAAYDPAKHRAVTIWCERFGVNFATAPLAPARP